MSPADPSASRGPHVLPKLFVDRSLGRIQVPALLRESGLELLTLAEHYGIPADESIDDVTWLADAARLGWAVLAKDERIRRRPTEREAIRQHGARCFYFTRGDLQADEYARRVLRNVDAIARACADDGPFIYVIHPTRIELMRL